MGNTNQSSPDYYKDIQNLEKRLNVAKRKGDRQGEVKACGQLGECYESIGKYYKAIEYHEKCLIIAKEIGDRPSEGKAYGCLGNAYKSLGEYQKAIEYHEKRLSIAKEIGDRRGEGNAYGNLGIVYRSLGEYHKSIEHHEKSLSIAKEIGDRQSEGNSYGSLGNVYQSLGENHKAVEYYEKMLCIAKKICDQRGEGIVYGNLGNAYKALGKYHKAIEYYEKSLSICKAIGHRQGEGTVYGNLGNTFDTIGEHLKAIEHFKKRLDITKEIGDRQGEGSACSSLGNAYQSLGEYDKAVEYFEKSLSIAIEIGDRGREGVVYGHLGIAFHLVSKHHEAVEFHKKRLSITKAIGDKWGEGSTYRCLGSAYYSLEEYHKTVEYFEKSLSIAEETGDRHGEAESHYSFGICYKAESSLKDLNKSEEHLQKSIECYENLFDDLKDKDQFKISFVDTYVKTYKVLIKVLLQLKQTEKALLICERGRARALRDLLSVKYNTIKISKLKQKSLELNDVRTILKDSCLLFYDVDLKKLAARFWVIDSSESIFFYDEDSHGRELEKEYTESDLYNDGIENVGNEYFQHLVQNSFNSMGVREGMVCEDRSLGTLQCEDLEEASSKPISKSNETSPRCVWMDEEDDEPLEILFDRLISPVLNKLKQEEIVIIPDGPLFMVPFAALRDPKTHKFLSERKRLRMAPSLTTLKLLQESSEDHRYKGALIIGDPDVGEVMYRGIKRDIYPLQGAMIEALEISQLLGVKPLIREQATKGAIIKRLQHGVSVIHFAAHGSAQKGEIFLAPSQPSTQSTTPEEKDYMLTMKEVQESRIRAQLVVLSCCHSGRGDIKAEGVVGMTRAFLAAGARAVVASLWAIDDQATRLFMLKFYSHLKNRESASRSLQQAMKEMRETDMYKEPKYWAAFFLIGDDVTIAM